jgi:hypothetical protein
VIVQDAVPVVAPAASVHLLVLVKVPVLLVAKLTVPDGVVGLGEVSVTVAVQEVEASIVAELGEQMTVLAVVDPKMTSTQPLVPSALLASPL